MEGQVVGPPAPGVEEMEIEDAISLYDPATDRVLVLNATASSATASTLEEIVQVLADAYADADTVREGVAAAVTTFREAGLLR